MEVGGAKNVLNRAAEEHQHRPRSHHMYQITDYYMGRESTARGIRTVLLTLIGLYTSCAHQLFRFTILITYNISLSKPNLSAAMLFSTSMHSHKQHHTPISTYKVQQPSAKGLIGHTAFEADTLPRIVLDHHDASARDVICNTSNIEKSLHMIYTNIVTTWHDNVDGI